MQNRIETHCHTDASNIRLLDSINPTEKVIDYAIKLGLKGIAITDHECLTNHIKAIKYMKKLKENGENEDFKLILGNEIYITKEGLSGDTYEKGDRFNHFILLAKDEIGHRQLREISTRAWSRSFFRFMERVPTYMSDLEAVIGKEPGHLIGATACIGGFIGAYFKDSYHKNNTHGRFMSDPLSHVLGTLKDLFKDDFYLEIQPGTTQDQIDYNNFVYELNKQTNIPVIVTTDAHYTDKSKREVHKAYLNSKNGEREVDAFYSHTYLMDSNEIHGHLHYLPTDFVNSCLQNTILIGDKIEEYDLAHKQIVPLSPVRKMKKYTVDAKYSNINLFLNSTSEQDVFFMSSTLAGLEKEKIKKPKYDVNAALDRLEIEADEVWKISERLGERISAYFMTMENIVNIIWEDAKSFIGPARGSAASFLTCYLLGITQVDPLVQELQLPHWRFLTADRPDMPDIDIDTESSKRDLIFDKVQAFYQSVGGDAINVCTLGTEGSKSAIQSSCRGLGVDSDVALFLSSLVPVERGFPWSISDCYYGDPSKEKKRVSQFVTEVNKYPKLLETILEIEGLICRRGIHAAGILITNEPFTEHNAMMRAPKRVMTSQWDLHDSEYMGGLKYDFLSIDALDKMRTAFDLLIEYRYIKEEKTLKETYDKYLGLDSLDLENKKIWEMVEGNKVLDLFQFSTNIARSALNLIEPTRMLHLVNGNSLMRLMPKGMENPVVSYVKNKNSNNATWIEEMEDYGLDEDEIAVIYKHLEPLYGIADTQESIMILVMDEKVANFSVLEANILRKAIGKKDPKVLAEVKEIFFNKGAENGIRDIFLHYIWEVQVSRQIGYAFNLPHTLAYTYIAMQELNLLLKYPSIFWNTACLIVNAGAIETAVDEDEVVDPTEKVKNISPKYGKIASAIGKMQAMGVTVSLPSINDSTFGFKPVVATDEVLYGLKGITGIGNDILNNIIANRPYCGIADFMSKVKVNKTQMVNLIKCGSFDKLYRGKSSRKEILNNYVSTIADKKKKLTLQNARMLIDYNLIPAELSFQSTLFEFNRYLKTFKFEEYYLIDERAQAFYMQFYDIELLTTAGEENSMAIEQKAWDKIYKKEMDPLRDYLKGNCDKLAELNDILFDQMFKKYGNGTQSKWEMDSVGFYHGVHELHDVDKYKYNISEFANLPEEPEIATSFFTKTQKRINLFKLYNIVGTVLDKDKLRHTVTILDTSGVAVVKVYNSQFSKFDKQVSVQQDGKRKIMEKSWFTRGNILLIQGYRRGDQFIPKAYKKSVYEKPIKKVVAVNGKDIVLIHERYGEE